MAKGGGERLKTWKRPRQDDKRDDNDDGSEEVNSDQCRLWLQLARAPMFQRAIGNARLSVVCR